jgi:flagellar biosynthesis/type III secretory pathway protein FliH
MKAQKSLAILATVSLLGLSVACSDRYAEGLADGKAQGYATGYDAGYDDGYLDGDEAGYERARAYFASADYNAGFNDGKAVGISQGYASGYSAGQTNLNVQVTAAYNNGYNNGYGDGYDDGYDDGVFDGYDMGYDDGIADGYDIGYDDGFADGYDVGYDDGFYDGGFSVGKSKALKGYANLLSMAHNDMFDYKKIAAPKSTARGIVANGKLLFEETSLTNKDTLKRAAVVEQYLVIEMAKQVKSKFGLSAERSLKVAKASNHFRKFASKRALTNEDTNAYVTEMIGVDLKTIEAAKEAGDMKSVLEAAASKNGTSPEKMAEVLAKHFI